LEVLEGDVDLVVIEHATGVETHGTQANMPIRQVVMFETKTAQA
jgi:superfamily II RNA helicase